MFWKNANCAKRTYHIAVEQVKPLTIARLLDDLEEFCVDQRKVTEEMVHAKLKSDDSDFEIETDTLNISLMCPLLNARMSLPGRSKYCQHVQCFDLKSYIMMNERKSTWKCPVCTRDAPYNDLRIDQLTREILCQCGEDVQEIIFEKDGSWSMKTQKVESGYGSTEEPMDLDESIIDLCGNYTF